MTIGATVVRKPHWRPSYKSGYARSASESANPGLWKGLEGAWYPELGVGPNMPDLSGRGNIAVASSGMAGSDWIVSSDRGYVVDYRYLASSGPYFELNKNIVFVDGDPFTVSFWSKRNSITNWGRISGRNGADSYIGFLAGVNTLRYHSLGGDAYEYAITQDETKWHYFTVISPGGAALGHLLVSLYIDGVFHSQVDKLTADLTIKKLGRMHTGTTGNDGQIGGYACWRRSLVASEVMQLYIDHLAPFQLKQKVYSKGSAAASATLKVAVRKPKWRPSYKSGYARNAGESANPGLWEGLVGAWVPALGPTGLILHDAAGHGYDGTFMAMEASDWAIGQNGWTVDLGGTDEYVTVDGPQNRLAGTAHATLSAWIYRSSTANLVAVGFPHSPGNNRYRFDCLWYNSKLYCQVESGTSSSFPSVALTGTGWHHIAMAYDGTQNGLARLDVHIDGQSVTLTAAGSPPTSALESAANLGNFDIGRDSIGYNNKYSIGQVGTVLLYDCTLSPNDVVHLYREPLAPFQLKQKVYSKGSAAASATLKVAVRKPKWRPSYKSGYARNAGESANPGLWEGLVGAWVPALGPTGGTLRDVSGRGNDGTLTNMDLATDWVARGLEFESASTNLVDLSGDVGGDIGSIVVYVKPSMSYAAGSPWRRHIFGLMNSGGTEFSVHYGTHSSMRNFRGVYRGDFGNTITSVGGIYTSNTAFQQWHSVVFTWDIAGSSFLYDDGIPGVESTTTATAWAGATTWNIGFATYADAAYWDGIISVVLAYDRVLTSNEIAHLYREPLAPFQLKQKVYSKGSAAASATLKVAVRKPKWRPSYKSGYAKNANESEHPGLWEGLVGAWVPAIGVTGGILKDVSGRYNDGTLTNMDLSTDWVAGEKGWGLEFDAAADIEFVAMASVSLIDLSIVLLWSPTNVTDSTSNYGVVSHINDSNAVKDWNWSLGVNHADGDALRGVIGNGTSFTIVTSGAVLTAGALSHSVFTVDGSNLRLYNDGQLVGGPIAQTVTPASDGTFRIGSSVWFDLKARGDCVVVSVMIYSRAITPNEIVDLYHDPLALFRQKQRIYPGTPSVTVPGESRILQGLIKVNTSVASVLQMSIGLLAEIISENSTIVNTILNLEKLIESIIRANTTFTGDLSTGGNKTLEGTVDSITTLGAGVSLGVPFDSIISSATILGGTTSLGVLFDGTIDSTTTFGSQIQLLRNFTGVVRDNSVFGGTAELIIALDSIIQEVSSLAGDATKSTAGQVVLEGTVNSVSTVTGNVLLSIALAAILRANSTVNGVVSVQKLLAAIVRANSGLVGGGFGLTNALIGIIKANSSIIGSLDSAAATTILEGIIRAVTATSGDIERITSLTGTIQGDTSISSTLTLDILLTAASLSVLLNESTLTGDLTDSGIPSIINYLIKNLGVSSINRQVVDIKTVRRIITNIFKLP